MGLPKIIRRAGLIFAFCCMLVFIVATSSIAGDTSVETQTDTYSELVILTYDKDFYPEIDYRYYSEMKLAEEDISLSKEFHREYNDSPVQTKPQKQFSSDTAFVKHYFESLAPVYQFLDKERKYRWNNIAFDYTLSELDSSLYYKSEMFGWNFKAEAKSEAFDKSSVLIHWKRNF